MGYSSSCICLLSRHCYPLTFSVCVPRIRRLSEEEGPSPLSLGPFRPRRLLHTTDEEEEEQPEAAAERTEDGRRRLWDGAAAATEGETEEEEPSGEREARESRRGKTFSSIPSLYSHSLWSRETQ